MLAFAGTPFSFGSMGRYLDAQSAIDTLVRLGDYTPENAPAAVDLDQFVIVPFELEMETWLTWSPVRQTYTELQTTDEQGMVRLQQMSVLHVQSVKHVLPMDVQKGERELLEGSGWWRVESTLLRTSVVQGRVQVVFEAGLDPLPPVFATTVLRSIRAIVRKTGLSGDLSFLWDSPESVGSISLPGGLSKSLRGSSAESRKDDDSELAKLLFPLRLYRRKFVL